MKDKLIKLIEEWRRYGSCDNPYYYDPVREARVEAIHDCADELEELIK